MLNIVLILDVFHDIVILWQVQIHIWKFMKTQFLKTPFNEPVSLRYFLMNAEYTILEMKSRKLEDDIKGGMVLKPCCRTDLTKGSGLILGTWRLEIHIQMADHYASHLNLITVYFFKVHCKVILPSNVLLPWILSQQKTFRF